jgi:hypothetical protein
MHEPEDFAPMLPCDVAGKLTVGKLPFALSRKAWKRR